MKDRNAPSMLAMIAVAATTQGGAPASAGPFDARAPLVVAQATEKAVGQGEGVIKGVDAGERQLLISHGPISGSLQMSAMTMSFGVAPGVDLTGLSKGQKIKFTLSRDARGLYVIDEIRPLP
jgi:Cu(I)/Ag(I) efflux system periplasmic protein CusF